MNAKQIGLAIAAVALVFLCCFGLYGCNTHNRAAALREQYNAKEKTVQTAHDNMWKTIQQKYQVSDDYKAGFIQSIQAATEGRKGGSLFKSVQENMPGLPANLYMDVMATIEGKRDMLKREMDTEVDIAREYNTMMVQFPSSMFVSGPRIEPHLILSGKTAEAWDSGQDNDVNLHGDAAPKRVEK